MHDTEHITNYNQLSQKIQAYVKKQNWYQLHGVELVKCFLRFSLFFLAYFLFATQESFVLQALAIFIMAYAFTSVLISGIHQASHRSFVKSTLGNKLWGYFFTDFLIGKSSLWWYNRHIETHHPHPNDPEKEPKPFYFPWMNRYVYFFLVPYLVIPWFLISSIYYLRKQPIQLVLYLVVTVTGFYAFMLLFLVLGYSFFIAFLLTFLIKTLLAPVFMHLAVFNHIGLCNPQPAKKWIAQQTLTTRNIKRSWFLMGIGGNAFLDGHLEHHLFPRLSNHMIEKTKPLLVEHLKKEGYEYKEEGYFSCLKHCLEHYHSLFKDLPEALW